ncbi:hypothetical protein L6R49_29120, partial [Myxococcota bacterium]|nr:hypothetical protein [Myxococcota bacterium]
MRLPRALTRAERLTRRGAFLSLNFLGAAACDGGAEGPPPQTGPIPTQTLASDGMVAVPAGIVRLGPRKPPAGMNPTMPPPRPGGNGPAGPPPGAPGAPPGIGPAG